MLKTLSILVIIVCLHTCILCEPCQDQHIPQNFYFSSSLKRINFALEHYFNNSCPLTASPTMSSTLQKVNNGYSYLNPSEYPLGGLVYPENITYRISEDKKYAEIRWYTNSSVMTANYVISLQEGTIDCGFTIQDIDYGIYKNYPAYKVVGLCTEDGGMGYRGYWLMKYRAQNTYKLQIMDVIAATIPNNINPKYLTTSYTYSSSSSLATLSAKSSSSQTNFQYLLYQPTKSNFILYNSQKISNIFQRVINLTDVIFGLGDTRKITGYLDKKGVVIFSDGLQNSSWQIAEEGGKLYKLCWSSVIGLHTGNRVTFIQFDNLNSVWILDSVLVDDGLEFVVIGSYLIGYKNKTTHFYSLRNGNIFHRKQQLTDICFNCSSINIGGFQQDLCSTNSFYYNTSKLSIAPFSIHIFQTSTINLQWQKCSVNTTFHFSQQKIQSLWNNITLPNLNLNKACWIQTGEEQFIIVGQQSSYIDFYLCKFGQGNCQLFNRINGQEFYGECSLSVQGMQNGGNRVIHGVFSVGVKSVYVQIISPTNSLPSVKQYIELKDNLKNPQFLYQNYTDTQNFQISYITETSVQNNAFCHYYIRSTNNTISAQFNYPFEFQSYGYSHCVTNSTILLYRADQSGLHIKKVGLRKQKFYVLEDAITLGQYRNARVVCMERGIGISGRSFMNFVDERLKITYQWNINQYWDQEYFRATKHYIIRYNTQSHKSEIYDQITGFSLWEPSLKVISSYGDILCCEEKNECYVITKNNKQNILIEQ